MTVSHEGDKKRAESLQETPEEKQQGNTLPKEKGTQEEDTGEQGFKHEQQKRAVPEKEGIARFVVEQIPNGVGRKPSGAAVFLDAGSSVEFVAREIFKIEKERRLNLTLMTNNMGVFNGFNAEQKDGGPPLDNSLSLLLTGGQYDQDHDALFGDLAAASLNAFYPHIVIIGTSGFRVSDGLFCHGLTPERVIKEAIFKRPTEHRIIVCDYRKIGQTDSFLAGRFEEILNGATRCTIVTSTVPEQPPEDPMCSITSDNPQKRKEYYEERFDEQARLLAKLKEEDSGLRESKERLSLVKVDKNGVVVKEF